MKKNIKPTPVKLLPTTEPPTTTEPPPPPPPSVFVENAEVEDDNGNLWLLAFGGVALGVGAVIIIHGVLTLLEWIQFLY